MTIGPITVLSVRAPPADVHLTVAEAGKQLNLPVPAGRRLLYLGHGRSTIVLYDPEHQRSLYLPAANVTVETYNCETRRVPARHRNCPDGD